MTTALIDYQPRWLEDGAKLAASVAEVLGDRVVSVHHIGSTAVPALLSKDVIDLQATVLDFEGVGDLRGDLESLGFEFRPEIDRDHVPPWALPGQDWEKRYFSKRSAQRAHLHVRCAGRANRRYALLFRDYLRAAPSAAAAYATFKRHLAASAMDYVEVKDAFCDVVILSAEGWAQMCGWTEPS